MAADRLTSFAGAVATSAMLLASIQAQTSRDAAGIATGTATIGGVVVTAETPARPIRRASVTLVGDHIARLISVTDDSGRFMFGNLPAGRYTMSADRAAYVPASYGASRPGRPGTTIALAEGQQLANLSIPMLRGGVISGTITTESGEPAREARVSVLTYFVSPMTGERALGAVRIGLASTTDDRGAYRVYGVAPGEYLVVSSASVRTGARQITDADYQRALQQLRGAPGGASSGAAAAPPPAMGTAPIFFPGVALSRDAQMVTVVAGEERAGVNFTVRPVPVGKISGTVTGPDGLPMSGVPLNLVDNNRVPGLIGATALSLRANSDGQGRFTISGVTPGVYSLVARPVATASRSLWATAELTADGRDTTVDLTMRQGVTLSGRVIFDGARPPADLTRVRVGLQAAPVSQGSTLLPPSTMADSTGAFSLTGVVPGRFRLSVIAPGASAQNPEWFLKDIVAGNRSLLDAPIEVGTDDVTGVQYVLTDRPTELSGLMQDAAGRPAPEYYLIAFPRDASLWSVQSPRIMQTRPGVDGKYVFKGLPPGEYYLGALTDVQFGEWFDRNFLQRLVPTSISVTLAEGDKKVQDVRVK